jgi:Ca2+-binding EF-hand superfamily protein
VKRLMLALTFAGLALPIAGTAVAQASPDKAEKAKEMFAKTDANQDGAISLEEWTAAGRRERGFQMIDADHDGKVTPDELRAAAAKRGQ